MKLEQQIGKRKVEKKNRKSQVENKNEGLHIYKRQVKIYQENI